MKQKTKISALRNNKITAIYRDKIYPHYIKFFNAKGKCILQINCNSHDVWNGDGNKFEYDIKKFEP